MKKIKSAIALFLSFFMLLTILPTTVFAAEVPNITVYTTDSRGFVYVDPENATTGDIVTVYVNPYYGYTLETVDVRDGNGEWLDVSGSNPYFTFTMGASGYADVYVTFMDDNSLLSSRDFTVYYDVTALKSRHGEIYVNPDYATQGQKVTITVVPDKGYTLETLTASMADGSTVSTSQSGSNYTFTMPAGDVRVAATFMEDNTILNYFTEVSPSAYYYDAVMWAVSNGVTAGTSSTTFSPDENCTRAEFISFLYRAAGKPVAVGQLNYSDVSSNAYYADAVRWATGLGIVSGYNNSAFGPNKEVTREQAVSMLYQYVGAYGWDTSVSEDTNILSYRDIGSVSEYAITPFQWACGIGAVRGTNGYLQPKSTCTRAEIIYMLYKMFA